MDKQLSSPKSQSIIIQNQFNKLIKIVNDHKSLQNEIEMIFETFQSKLRERKKYILNEINSKYENQINNLQQQKPSPNLLNTTEFVVDSSSVCNYISNIGQLNSNHDHPQINNNDYDNDDDEKKQDNNNESILDEIILNKQNEYQCLHYSNISGTKMIEFMDCLNIQKQIKNIGTKINIKDIMFESFVSPNGNSIRTLGSVMFGVQVNYIPLNITKFIAYCALFCKNTNYGYKTTKIFQKKDEFQIWRPFSVSFNECKQFKSLTFATYIDIIYIDYKENNKLYAKPIQLNTSFNYTWNINKNQLNKFKDAVLRRYYSLSFMNGCFCLMCSPYGFKEKNRNTFIFQLKLLKLPYNVHAIRIEYVLESNLENFHYEGIQTLRYINPKSVSTQWTDQQINSNKLDTLDMLTLKISAVILGVIDDKEKEIDKKLWSKYGIDDNS